MEINKINRVVKEHKPPYISHVHDELTRFGLNRVQKVEIKPTTSCIGKLPHLSSTNNL